VTRRRSYAVVFCLAVLVALAALAKSRDHQSTTSQGISTQPKPSLAPRMDRPQPETTVVPTRARTPVFRAAPRPRIMYPPRVQSPAIPQPEQVVPAVAEPVEDVPSTGPATLPSAHLPAGDLIDIVAQVPKPGPDDPAPVVSNVHVSSVSAMSATVSWTTNVPTLGRVLYGIDNPDVWSAESGLSRDHEAVLTGLSVATRYLLSVRSLDEFGRVADTAAQLSTDPLGESTVAQSEDGGILVNGQPVFPRMVWGQCSDGLGANLADGINVFMGDDCKADRPLPEQLGGKAFSITGNANADDDHRGLIGSFYQDEWDAFLPSSTSLADLAPHLIPPRDGRLTFLTLTNHFYSKAAPLPQGKGMYPALLDVPDVVGFDLYPLQVWCRPAFADVFDSQNEIVQMSGGKPTFQWIETRQMEHEDCQRPALQPTPDTVRAETWLAVAGGATGIGYFPNSWSTEIGDTVEETNRELAELAPALQTPAVEAIAADPRIKVGIRELDGALYIIAVNSTKDDIDTQIKAEGLGDRKIAALGEARTLKAATTGELADSFGPLAVHVYVAAPLGW